MVAREVRPVRVARVARVAKLTTAPSLQPTRDPSVSRPSKLARVACIFRAWARYLMASAEEIFHHSGNSALYVVVRATFPGG